MSNPQEGDRCPTEDCVGILFYPKAENCSCHIRPPCAACTDVALTCHCGWREKIEMINDYRTVVGTDGAYESWRPRALDKTKVDWHSRSHTHASMIKEGVYPEGVSREEVEKLVKGSWGGRFESFGNGKFKYVAYTD